MDYIITFIEGLASFISPCILPMLPMYISYFAGKNKSLKKTIINSLGFILGFTIVFVLLGIFAGTLGKAITDNIKYVNFIIGAIIILFGLHYIGLIKIKFLEKSVGLKKMKENLDFFSAIIFGIIFSICWTPCVGLFLGSALMMSATSGSVFKGAIMLLLYAIGLGIPFLITAIFLEKLRDTFNIIKKHYNVVNIISGMVLIISGVFIML